MFSCRKRFRRSSSVLQPTVLYLASWDSSTEKPNTETHGQGDVGTPIIWRQALGTGRVLRCPQDASKMSLFIKPMTLK